MTPEAECSPFKQDHIDLFTISQPLKVSMLAEMPIFESRSVYLGRHFLASQGFLNAKFHLRANASIIRQFF